MIFRVAIQSSRTQKRISTLTPNYLTPKDDPQVVREVLRDAVVAHEQA